MATALARIVFCGDNAGAPGSQTPLVAAAMNAALGRFSGGLSNTYVIFGGDTYNPYASTSTMLHYDQYMSLANIVEARTIMVPGNHDNGPGGSSSPDVQSWLAYNTSKATHTRTNGGWINQAEGIPLTDQFWDIAGIRFFFLNSGAVVGLNGTPGWPVPHTGGSVVGNSRVTWLRQNWAAGLANVVVTHHPRYSYYGNHHDNNTMQNLIDEIRGVNDGSGPHSCLILQGHDHNTQIFKPQFGAGSYPGLTNVVAGFGSTAPYTGTPGSGNTSQKSWLQFVNMDSGGCSFIQLDIMDDGSIVLSALNALNTSGNLATNTASTGITGAATSVIQTGTPVATHDYHYRVDGGSLVDNSTSLSVHLSGLAPGTHWIEVKDTVSSVDSDFSSYAWTVPSIAPAAPTIVAAKDQNGNTVTSGQSTSSPDLVFEVDGGGNQVQAKLDGTVTGNIPQSPSTYDVIVTPGSHTIEFYTVSGGVESTHVVFTWTALSTTQGGGSGTYKKAVVFDPGDTSAEIWVRATGSDGVASVARRLVNIDLITLQQPTVKLRGSNIQSGGGTQTAVVLNNSSSDPIKAGSTLVVAMLEANGVTVSSIVDASGGGGSSLLTYTIDDQDAPTSFSVHGGHSSLVASDITSAMTLTVSYSASVTRRVVAVYEVTFLNGLDGTPVHAHTGTNSTAMDSGLHAASTQDGIFCFGILVSNTLAGDNTTWDPGTGYDQEDTFTNGTTNVKTLMVESRWIGAGASGTQFKADGTLHGSAAPWAAMLLQFKTTTGTFFDPTVAITFPDEGARLDSTTVPVEVHTDESAILTEVSLDNTTFVALTGAAPVAGVKKWTGQVLITNDGATNTIFARATNALGQQGFDQTHVSYVVPTPPPVPVPVPPPVPVPATDVEYTIQHVDHEGNAVGEVSPTTVEGTVALNDLGSVSYSVPLSSSMARRELTDPDLYDWVLLRNGVAIAGGPLDTVSPDTDDKVSLPVTGVTYEGYLADRIMPWNPGASNIENQFKLYQDMDLLEIVRRLLDYVLGTSNSIPITYDPKLSGIITTQEFDPSSRDSLLSIVQNLAALSPGFDFMIDADCHMHFWTPKKGVYTDLVLELDKNAQRISYTDSGIRGNRLNMSGSSATGSQAFRVREDLASQAQARIKDVVQDIGTVSSLSNLTQHANDEIKLSVQKQRDILVEARPNGEDYWSQAGIGDWIKVIGDSGYEVLNDFFRCTQIDFSFDASQTEVLTYTFSPNTTGV